MPLRRWLKQIKASAGDDAASSSFTTVPPTSADVQSIPRSQLDASTAPASSLRNDELSQPSTALHLHGSHTYGPVRADGHAWVQMGDVIHSHGPGAQLQGSYTVTGNMTVQNTYHTNDHGGQNATNDASLELRKALYYAAMDTRKAQLEDINTASFEWLWTQTTFPAWLESKSGIYWIKGKPASGKSTLLNHLTSPSQQLDKVKECLRCHHPNPLVVHFFFDFRAGKGIANSPVGMLRSMLLQLIEKSPAVEQHVLQKYRYRSGGQWPELESELSDILCDAIKSQGSFVCGFLDGLDEFEGKLIRLVDSILSLQARSRIKLCLASRPETEIAHRLWWFEGLLMQHYNRNTIDAYTTQQFSDLTTYISSEDLSSIAERISKDANGVILWARFAVDEAVNAILEGSNFEDLEVLLDAYPSELEGIYQKIWSKLDEPRKLQAAVILFVTQQWIRKSIDIRSDYQESKDLLLLSSRIISRLDGEGMVSSCRDLNVAHFRVKVHSLLRGLVEFVPTGARGTENEFESRIVHKTLRVFLNADKNYQAITDCIRTVINCEIVITQYLAENIVLASAVFQPCPFDHLPNCLTWDTERKLVVPSRNQIMEAVRWFCFDKDLDYPQYTSMLLGAAQTWIHRQWALDDSQQRLKEIVTTLPPKFLYLRTLPELFTFLLEGHHLAFSAALEETSNILSEDDKDCLFLLVLNNVYTRLLMSSGGNTWNWDSSFLSISLLIIKDMCLSARIMSLCISSEVQLLAVSDLVSDAVKEVSSHDITISTSAWWPHEDSHFLVVWVASVFNTHSVSVQKLRLAKLLTLDLSLNKDVYVGGNVMDALFDPRLLKNNHFLPVSDYFYSIHPLPHFSQAKFDALVGAGFEINSKCKKLLHAAEKLLDYFYDRDQEPEEDDDPHEAASSRESSVVTDAVSHSRENHGLSSNGEATGQSSVVQDEKGEEDVDGKMSPFSIEDVGSGTTSNTRESRLGMLYIRRAVSELEEHVIPFLKAIACESDS